MSSNPREQLADLLKRSREDAGYGTQAAFARAAHISRPVISRAEKGEHPLPSPEVLARYTSHTAADPEEIRELVKRATGGTPEWFMSYRRAEAEATTLRLWAPMILPGLVQTEAYAREVIAVSATDDAHLNELVAVRLERQRVLDRIPVCAVVSARVLQVQIGTAATMADQVSRVVSVAEQQNVSLHVVTEHNTGSWAALDIASKGCLITVCMTTGVEDITSTDPGTIDRSVRAFDRVLGLAMPCAQSLDFLRTQEQEWKARI